jgi:hypothetical protein
MGKQNKTEDGMRILLLLLIPLHVYAGELYLSGDVGIENKGEGQLCNRVVIPKITVDKNSNVYYYNEDYSENYVGMVEAGIWGGFYAISGSMGYSYISCLSDGETIQGPHVGVQVGHDGFINLTSIWAGTNDLGEPKSVYGEYICKLSLGGKISPHIVLKVNALAGCQETEKPPNYSLTVGLAF